MANLKELMYTLVRHDGHYLGKPQFDQAVGMAIIRTDKELATVRRAGGLVFTNYARADEAETDANGDGAAVLKAPGTFSKLMLNHRHIYIPPASPEAFANRLFDAVSAIAGVSSAVVVNDETPTCEVVLDGGERLRVCLQPVAY